MFPSHFLWLFISLGVFFFLLGQNYFGDAWNVFDFIIVLGSFIDIIYTEVNVSILSARLFLLFKFRTFLLQWPQGVEGLRVK